MVSQNLSEQQNVHILNSMCAFYTKSDYDLHKG